MGRVTRDSAILHEVRKTVHACHDVIEAHGYSIRFRLMIYSEHSHSQSSIIIFKTF